MKKIIKPTQTESKQNVKIGSSSGLVYCNKCGVIRSDDGSLYDICHICEEGKWMHINDIDTDQYAGDVKEHRKQILNKLIPWELTIPDNVEIALFKANSATGMDRMQLIMQAHVKAESYYYSAWANGKIKAKKKPMPEDVKNMLKNRNVAPDVVNKDPLMKITIARVKRASPHEISKLYEEVHGATAGPNVTTERRRQSIIETIIQMNERGERSEAPPEPPEEEKNAVTNKPSKEHVVAKHKKTPIHEDKAAQAEKESKYTWIISGSWRPEPGHENKTILDIKCIKCGNSRTIHAGDAFQVKLCRDCKPSKGK